MSSILSFLHSQFFVRLPNPKYDYTGKTVIVTGSNTGLGKEAARHFARLGAAKVILAVRSVEKGEAAQKEIIASTKTSQDIVQVWNLDMSSYESVQAFAARVAKELDRLDVALLNAGVSASTFRLAENYESTITVNVISTFLLSLLLLPKLKATAEKYNVRPNLCITSSETHQWTKFKEQSAPEGKLFDAFNDKEHFDVDDRYMCSKLLEVLSIRAMADQKSASQIPVTINTVNPGFCHSELARDKGFAIVVMKFFLARTTEAGSRNLVAASSMGPESHGQYVSDCKVVRPSTFVRSKEGERQATRVWKELEVILEEIEPGVTKNL